MRTLLLFLSRIEYIVYVLAGVGVFFSIRALVQAGVARRNTVFGLEREAAQNRQSRALTTILALFMLSAAVYIIVNIVTPSALSRPELQPTATQPIVFVTQQATATEARLLFPTVTPTPGLPPVAGATTPPPVAPGETCGLLGARITSPVPDQTVTGQVVVQGGANTLNFAEYKFEIKSPATGDAWVVVATNNVAVPDPGFLGTWDSTSLPPGKYTLRLVVIDLNGGFPTPCEVPINIASPAAQFGPTATANP